MKVLLRDIYCRYFKKKDDFFSIHLELDRDIHLLSSEYGEMLAATQVVPLIKDNKKIKIFFPEYIKVVNNSFLGGFMREILNEDKDFEISISADNDVLSVLSDFYAKTESEMRDSIEAQQKQYDKDLKDMNDKEVELPG